MWVFEGTSIAADPDGSSAPNTHSLRVEHTTKSRYRHPGDFSRPGEECEVRILFWKGVHRGFTYSCTGVVPPFGTHPASMSSPGTAKMSAVSTHGTAGGPCSNMDGLETHSYHCNTLGAGAMLAVPPAPALLTPVPGSDTRPPSHHRLTPQAPLPSNPPTCTHPASMSSPGTARMSAVSTAARTGTRVVGLTAASPGGMKPSTAMAHSLRAAPGEGRATHE